LKNVPEIRLARAGAKKRPFYRIVIADSRYPRDGRFIEIVGTYEPILPKTHEKRTVLNAERIQHWLSKGASRPTGCCASSTRRAWPSGRRTTIRRRPAWQEGAGALSGSRGAAEKAATAAETPAPAPAAAS